MLLGPFREHLKIATRTQHQKVDALFSQLNLSERHGYSRFLHANWLAFNAIEQLYEADACAGPQPPRMALAIRQDLDTLGHNASPAACVALPTGSDLLGPIYVTTGAHFGKRVLLRRWQTSHDPCVLAAKQYITSDTMAGFWPTVVAALDSGQLSEQRKSAIVASTNATFSLFATAVTVAESS